MNWMKAALVLVFLAMLHPGFAVLCVGLGTLGMAFEAAWSLGRDRPPLMQVVDAARDPPTES
jgi:hypothetical protein